MIFLDFETTNLDKGSATTPENRVVMVSWAVDDGPIKNYTGDLLDAAGFWFDLNTADHACAWHAKFEIKWLKRYGYDVDRLKWHDPMLGEKVLLGNIKKPMGLGEVAERYGYDTKDPMIDSMMKSGVCPSEMPQKRLRARCNRDVRVTRSLYQRIVRELRRQEQIHLYRNRCDFSVVLAHIESEGMILDPARVQKAYDACCTEVALLKKALDVLTGGINMNSSDQKAEFLYTKLKFPEKRGANRRPLRNKPSKRWPDGKPKTDKDTLVWLAGQAKTADQQQFIELSTKYSKATAALSKNLEFFQGVCAERDGKFFAQFNQTVAATHRLTSSGIPIQFLLFEKPKSVQFQNMPREFKSCFTAPEGYEIVEVDAMQLEFRVAAYEGQDKQAMKDIADPDFDAHCTTAAVMQGVDYTEFLERYRDGVKLYKKWRTEAKPDTFKPLYGGTRGTPEQERYYESFRQRYEGLAREQQNWLAEVCQSGELRTTWGMVFKWNVYTNNRGVAMNKGTHKPVGPQVFNYPVQNLATAEIVPIAIVALYKRCKEEELDVIFINTVHDSVICYVRTSDDGVTMEKFIKAASWAFTTAVYEHLSTFYGIEFNVPLGMEMVSGDHWNEGTEIKHDDVEERK